MGLLGVLLVESPHFWKNSPCPRAYISSPPCRNETGETSLNFLPSLPPLFLHVKLHWEQNWEADGDSAAWKVKLQSPSFFLIVTSHDMMQKIHDKALVTFFFKEVKCSQEGPGWGQSWGIGRVVVNLSLCTILLILLSPPQPTICNMCVCVCVGTYSYITHFTNRHAQFFVAVVLIKWANLAWVPLRT